jgi:hypothetical protein
MRAATAACGARALLAILTSGRTRTACGLPREKDKRLGASSSTILRPAAFMEAKAKMPSRRRLRARAKIQLISNAKWNFSSSGRLEERAPRARKQRALTLRRGWNEAFD